MPEISEGRVLAVHKPAMLFVGLWPTVIYFAMNILDTLLLTLINHICNYWFEVCFSPSEKPLAHIH